MNESKQSQIEDIIRKKKVDVIHLQEADIGENTFDTCSLICSSYDIIPNNAQNGYGTASIIKSDLTVTNVRLDTLSKCIVFDDLKSCTLGSQFPDLPLQLWYEYAMHADELIKAIVEQTALYNTDNNTST